MLPPVRSPAVGSRRLRGLSRRLNGRTSPGSSGVIRNAWMFGALPGRIGLPDQKLSKQLRDPFAAYQASLKLQGRNGFGTITADIYSKYLLEKLPVSIGEQVPKGPAGAETQRIPVEYREHHALRQRACEGRSREACLRASRFSAIGRQPLLPVTRRPVRGAARRCSRSRGRNESWWARRGLAQSSGAIGARKHPPRGR